MLEKEYKRRNMQSIADVHTAIKDVQTALESRTSLKNDLEKKQIAATKIEQQLNELNHQLQELQQSKEYEDQTNITQQQEELNEQITQTKHTIYHSFAVIEAALKKYERVAYENAQLIKNFLKDPVQALLTDKEFKINAVLDKLKENIESGSVELKDSKRKRILEELATINQDFFSSFINKYNALEKNLREIKEQLKKFTVNKEIAKIQAQLDQINEKQLTLKAQIQADETQLNSIDIKKMIKEIEAKIQNVLKIDVTLIL